MGPRLHSGVEVALQPKHVWPWFSVCPELPSSVFCGTSGFGQWSGKTGQSTKLTCFLGGGPDEFVGAAAAGALAVAVLEPFVVVPLTTPSFVSSLVMFVVVVGTPFAPLSDE